MKKTYKGIKRIYLIGGGDLMASTADTLSRSKYEVCSIVAPRHAYENLHVLGGTLIEKLHSIGGMTVIEVENINNINSWFSAGIPNSLAICFGPSWIFTESVIKLFSHGMVNINPIPMPNYLGGAHFTWQILNGDRQGGCYIQEITSDIDKGDILLSHRFKVPKLARTPADYFHVYFNEGVFAINNFVKCLYKAVPLPIVDFKSINNNRLYFPRLITTEQAYIDWSWPAVQIEQFCNAFDDPYSGAMTFLDGRLLHLKKVEFINTEHNFHPFCSGLIVRCTDDEVLIAVQHGSLRIGIAVDKNSQDVLSSLKEGRRMITPIKYLDYALHYHPRLSAKGLVSTKESI